MNEVIVLDLPSLKSVQLGEAALRGRNVPLCSLKMRSTNRTEWND